MIEYLMKNLKFLRERMEYSQFYLAEYLGLDSPSLISDWKNGLNHPRLPHLMKLSELYDYNTPVIIDDNMQATLLIHLPEIEFKKLSDKAVIPHRAHSTDAGLDLYTVGVVSIEPHSSITIPTDLAINLPPGFEAQIRPRSGVTSKTKLRVQLGTIDSGYQGNIGIMVDNIGDETIILQEAYKLAQLVISPIVTPKVKMVSEFNVDSERGSNGFGSSGI